MKYIKDFVLNESFDFNKREIDDMKQYCIFKDNNWEYKTTIGGKRLECFAYDKGTKFDYKTNDSYNTQDLVKNITDDTKVLQFAKNAVYHHLITHNPDFLYLKAVDSKNRKLEKKKERIYRQFLIEIVKNLPQYKLNMDPDESHLPYNVYLDGTETDIIPYESRGNYSEHYTNGLLNSIGKNKKETLIKNEIYFLEGFEPAIRWLDGTLDTYAVNGQIITYPYCYIHTENGKKNYFSAEKWQLKKDGIL
jgi:hypothetical protein